MCLCGIVNKVGNTAGNAWPRHSFPLHNLLSYAYTLYYNFSFFLQIRMPLSREAQNATSKKALNWVCIVPYKIAPDLRLSFFGTVTITLSIIPMKWALALSPIRRPPINMRRPHIINTIHRGHHLHHQHCHCHRQMRRMPIKAVPLLSRPDLKSSRVCISRLWDLKTLGYTLAPRPMLETTPSSYMS